MKKLTDILFSMVTSVILLLIFGAAIGYATFAENSSGTPYAHDIVYNAKWFELLLVLLIVNMVGSAIRFKMTNKKKFSMLLFHLSFIVILIGAGITRYFGSEGVMHLRQGETSSEITSEKSSVRITAEYNGQKEEKTTEFTFSETESNDFSKSISVAGKTINIQNILLMPNAIEAIEEDPIGEPAFDLFVMSQSNQGMEVILSVGESKEYGGQLYAFGDKSGKADVNFKMDGDNLLMKSKVAVSKMAMMESSESALAPGTLIPVQERTIYKSEKAVFVLKKYLQHAKKSLTQYNPESNKMGVMMKGRTAVVFNVSDGNTTKQVNVMTAENETPEPGTCMINNIKVSISYGNLPQELPFSITLREFQLDRYPGSNSPSSYASEITVNDPEMKVLKPFRIYMNNILNYRGYRFFQSSYDQDEKGTILSVNQDYWGTLVTYVGYFFMLIGMVLTLFNKNSRFHTVIRLSKSLQDKRKVSKALFVAGLLFCSASMFAVDKNSSKKDHFEALSSLLIQDEAQGRIEPISTYASDVIRKISKKTSYNGQSALEVFVGMMLNPTQWQAEPVIKVAHEGLAKELGATKDYVSFNQLVDMQHGGIYKLSEKVNAAYQKDPSQRNQYEKELINVDERLNILNSIFTGTLLKIFPVQNDKLGKWVAATSMTPQTQSEPVAKDAACPMTGKTGMTDKPAVGTPAETMNSTGDKCPVTGKSGKAGKIDESAMQTMPDSGAKCPAGGEMNVSGMTSGMPVMTPTESTEPDKLLSDYLSAVQEGYQNGNWSDANTTLLSLKNFQILNGGSQLPTKTHVKLEVLYNNLSIFLTLAILYGLIGMILISLHLFNILKYNPKIEKWLDKSIYPLGIMFIVYTAGLALRWYISNHAPWSNGYESMIFVGWATTMAGLVFAMRSPITLAITSLLAAIALAVAGMSWMNPEITNLVPVLKSYWLVIHVAVITSSYGFFATAALLALFNLCLMIGRNQKNAIKLNDSILEFSYIIELTLTIGLFMLTVGTFLGGIWANESWGRYWGWDSKETWALVSVLAYSAILHLRKIPKMNNLLIFNTVSILGFGSIIMTYFGVNYYLSGMHSYGQGTPPPIPIALYFILAGIVLLVTLAYFKERKLK
ncbi:MAG: cytochrome c biogenesis protein CcsA [Paludibacter sp.]